MEKFLQDGFWFLLGWFTRDIVELVKTHFHKNCPRKNKSNEQK
jgi:hypothetical protein